MTSGFINTYFNNKKSKCLPLFVNYPEELYISGFPFLFQGWNGKLKMDKISDAKNFPTYRMESYMLYGIFPIRPLGLKKYNDIKWVLFIDEPFPVILAELNEEHFCGGSNSDLFLSPPVGKYESSLFKIIICKNNHGWF